MISKINKLKGIKLPSSSVKRSSKPKTTEVWAGFLSEDISGYSEQGVSKLIKEITEADQAFEDRRKFIISTTPHLPPRMRIFLKELVIKNTPDSIFQNTKQQLAHFRRSRRQFIANKMRSVIYPIIKDFIAIFLAKCAEGGFCLKGGFIKQQDVNNIIDVQRKIDEILGQESDKLLTKSNLRELFRHYYTLQSQMDKCVAALKSQGIIVDKKEFNKITSLLGLAVKETSVLYDQDRRGFNIVTDVDKKTGISTIRAVQDHTAWHQLSTRGKIFRVSKRTLQVLKYLGIALAITGLIVGAATTGPAAGIILGVAGVVLGTITISLQLEKIVKWSFNKIKDHVATTRAQVKQAPEIVFWITWGIVSVVCGAAALFPSSTSVPITNPVTIAQKAQVFWDNALDKLRSIVQARAAIGICKKAFSGISGLVGKIIGIKAATEAVHKVYVDYKTNVPVENTRTSIVEMQPLGSGGYKRENILHASTAVISSSIRVNLMEKTQSAAHTAVSSSGKVEPLLGLSLSETKQLKEQPNLFAHDTKYFIKTEEHKKLMKMLLEPVPEREGQPVEKKAEDKKLDLADSLKMALANVAAGKTVQMSLTQKEQEVIDKFSNIQIPPSSNEQKDVVVDEHLKARLAVELEKALKSVNSQNENACDVCLPVEQERKTQKTSSAEKMGRIGVFGHARAFFPLPRVINDFADNCQEISVGSN